VTTCWDPALLIFLVLHLCRGAQNHLFNQFSIALSEVLGLTSGNVLHQHKKGGDMQTLDGCPEKRDGITSLQRKDMMEGPTE
jgi:hypothetical protein